ncbi:putative Zn finger-like uncharacterized protein [Psychrobacter luti]|uniref:Putative Zn finger-like uncharacterized protein n=1 Tax=Psychrobacter luti TaxID=198481 RepID=A0A839TD66_9GAMM|nr:DUF3426 domain-containing protein [Psychrobacter luti]MBB3107422.1 putative Zn finger-like uncharacterized protein [Psychrobacter luti]
MTTPIKTQCPHCHAILNINKTQLDKKTANVCCEHCQHSFLVNNNLIVTADTERTREDIASERKTAAVATPNIPIHKQNPSVLSKTESKPNVTSEPAEADILIHDDMIEDEVIHDGLIYDDMDIDGFEDKDKNEHVEYDSLDSMDAWLTQAVDSNNSNSAAIMGNQHAKNTPTSLTKSTHSSVNPIVNPSLRSAALKEQPSAAHVAISSTAANDIHANIDDSADESWLEKLLKEQNKSEDTPKDQTDLSELLASMGVSLKEEDHSKAARLKQQQTQAKFSPTPARRSIASLLWTLGCLVLALLLFAQYVIFNLDNLVKNPAHAERLQKVCAIVACSLPSANLAALSTSDIKHQSSRINTASSFSDISITLNNQSTQAQLLPHVKVSVHGNKALIGEFIAAPQDYLLSTQSQLGAQSRKQLLFTVPVANAQISKVSVTPVY